MPRGFGGVRDVSAEAESRRGSPGAGALWFRLKAGEDAVVRFLEQDDDVFWAMMHEVPVEGRSWGRDVACLDQDKDGTPCPGCERDLPRRFKGFINLIWDNSPVFKRDKDNRLVKDSTGDNVVLDRRPQVAIWSSGIRLFDDLAEINANYKGLSSRKFRVKRKGEGLETRYSIAPEDIDSGPQNFSEAENKLIAAKYDLGVYTVPRSYEDFLKELGQAPSQGGNGSGEQSQGANPFMRHK